MVEVGATSFVELVQLGFDQLRQYSRSDMAMSLRILRSLADIADATPHETGRAALRRQGRLVWESAHRNFPAEDCEALDERWERLRARTEARGALPEP